MDALTALFASSSVLAAVVMVVAAARVALRVHGRSAVRWWAIGGGLALGVLPGAATLYDVAGGGHITGDQLWRGAALAVAFSAVAAGLWRLVPALAELNAARQALHTQERILAASEGRFRGFVETMRCGLVLWSPDGEVEFSNPAVAAIFGYSEIEFARLHRSDLRLEEQSASGVASRQRRLAGQATPVATFRSTMLAKGGRRIEIASSVTVFERDGDVVGSLAEYRDVTTEAEAERALRESEQRNRVIVDSVATPLTVWDPQSRLLHHNRAACDLTGYSPSELAAIQLRDLLDDQAAKLVSADAVAARSGGAPDVRVCELRRKDGDVRTVALSIAAVEFPGEENALLLQTIDVTAQVEEERHLHQTQKLEAIGTLVSGVAHDFNNLLTAIGGSLELASQELQPSEWLDRARLATDDASDRVRQLLQFSKRQPVRPAIVDLGSLATETVDLVRQTTDGRVTFEVAPSSGVNVWADRKQTQQALMNLLANARDAVLERLATVDGTDVPFQPRVDVAVSRSSQDEGWGELTVSDNGVGMADDVLECIFDPFFTTKAADGSAGLGMSIVFAIVTDHDGTVTVDSAPDRGTTVRVQLPVAVAADGEAGGSSAPSAGPPQTRKQGTILVVDDEPIITEFAQSVLTRAGYDVVSTTNGDEALIELLRRPYDLMLLDVNMPAPNGWQVLHEALTLNPEQCIMMLSGFALEEEAKERGAVGLIQKPFNGSTLIEQVAGTLRDRSPTERTAVEV